jgi:hypothetical protein
MYLAYPQPNQEILILKDNFTTYFSSFTVYVKNLFTLEETQIFPVLTLCYKFNFVLTCDFTGFTTGDYDFYLKDNLNNIVFTQKLKIIP